MDDATRQTAHTHRPRLNAGSGDSPHADTAALLSRLGRDARQARAGSRRPRRRRRTPPCAPWRPRSEPAPEAILAANREDVAEAKAKGQAASFIDRLALDPNRLEAVAAAVESIADLPDPVGRVLAVFERPNGLIIERVATPLGVVGVIFESRPNVTADAGALCLKAGNAAILRAGSDSFRTSREIAEAMGQGLEEAGLPRSAVQLVPTRDRAAVGAMLAGLDGNIDVIVPRGGKSLVARVQAEARVPVFAHLEGIVHVYVDRAADLEMAKRIVLNAKMRRTGVCGAAETLLVDRACASTHLKPLVTMLLDAGCTVCGDEATQAVDPRVTPATEDDWRTEYLDSIIACRVVAGLDGAVDHIETYGSHHTDAIVTDDAEAAERFWHRSIPPSCCTTPRRSSPTAASSASAPRSGSRRAGCMPGGRWASTSSPPSSTASAGPGQTRP